MFWVLIFFWGWLNFKPPPLTRVTPITILILHRFTRLKLLPNLTTDLFYFAPPPQLCGHKSFMPPGARAIFLHSNVQYNNIQFVTGGHKKHWGGAKQNRSLTIFWGLFFGVHNLEIPPLPPLPPTTTLVLRQFTPLNLPPNLTSFSGVIFWG